MLHNYNGKTLSQISITIPLKKHARYISMFFAGLLVSINDAYDMRTIEPAMVRMTCVQQYHQRCIWHVYHSTNNDLQDLYN